MLIFLSSRCKDVIILYLSLNVYKPIYLEKDNVLDWYGQMSGHAAGCRQDKLTQKMLSRHAGNLILLKYEKIPLFSLYQFIHQTLIGGC